MEQDLKCKDLVNRACKNRFKDLKQLWNAQLSGENEGYVEDLGCLYEYGLSFEYVAPFTFNDQPIAFFRYMFSTGGPQEELRYFVNPDFSCYKIEFWYLNWFDGAKIILTGVKKQLALDIFEDLRECGTVEHIFKEATKD